MARPIVLLALICAYTAVASIINPLDVIESVIDDTKDQILEDIADVKQSIEEDVVSIANTQCSTIKKLLGVSYEALDGENEPDMNELSLVYRNSQVTVTFNISSAAELIPKSTGFDLKQKLYIFIHGFTDSPYKTTFTNISNALFSQGNANVLALDASSLIKWLYLRSSTYVTFIGEKLGEVLAAMVKYGVEPDQIHIIGHSLGAHISGFAGKQFYNLTGSHVGRISGLDPAGPCFANVETDLRLKATDAKFVDVIHTDAGVLGLDQSVGHVDYWPNGGSQQVNCLFESCCHGRTVFYFAESVVTPNAFPAVKCGSWAAFKKGNCSNEISYMGFPSNSSASGNYYLRTDGESPYGLGVNGTHYDESKQGIVQKVADLFG